MPEVILVISIGVAYLHCGSNISPTELERVLFSNTKIREAVIVGVPDDFRELIRMHAEKDNEELSEKEVDEILEGHLDDYRRITR